MVKAGHKYAEQAIKWFVRENIRAARWVANTAQRGWNVVNGWFGRGGTTTVNYVHTFARSIMDGTIGKGFQTFDQLKRYLGSAAPGHHWHHIVEQSQIAKSGFDRLIIHNTHNMMQLPVDVHRKVTGFFNSVPQVDLVNTGGLKFRDWLAGQSFEVQFQWGLDVIQMHWR